MWVIVIRHSRIDVLEEWLATVVEEYGSSFWIRSGNYSFREMVNNNATFLRTRWKYRCKLNIWTDFLPPHRRPLVLAH